MTQTNIFDQVRVPPNPFKPGTQNWRLYEALRQGPVTNGDIIYKMRIANSTGRTSEIREFLAPHGIHLDCKRVHEGLFEYQIQGGAA